MGYLSWMPAATAACLVCATEGDDPNAMFAATDAEKSTGSAGINAT